MPAAMERQRIQVALAVAIVAAALGGVWALVASDRAPAPLEQVATFYGHHLAHAEARVDASVDGVPCASTVSDENGFWTLQIRETAPCLPVDGAVVTFTLDAGPALDASIWTAGGVAVVVESAPPTQPDPLTAAEGDAVFSIENVGNASLTAIFPNGVSREPLRVSFTPVAQLNFLDTKEVREGPLDVPDAADVVPAMPAAEGDATLRVVSVFALGATTSDGAPVGEFGVPVSLGLTVVPEVVGLAGGDPARIELWQFDRDAGRWQRLDCGGVAGTVDVVRCATLRFSRMAIAVASPLW